MAGETATAADVTHPTGMHSCKLSNQENPVKMVRELIAGEGLLKDGMMGWMDLHTINCVTSV